MNSSRRIVKVAAPALVAVAAGAVAVATLTARSPDGDGMAARRASPGQSATPLISAAVGGGDDPAGWKLPIETYMFSKSQVHTMNSRRAALMADCVKRAGLPAPDPAPDAPDLDGRTETDLRYGIHDAALAARRGYHPDAADQEAHDRAIAAGAAVPAGADGAVVRGCSDEAGVTVPAPTQAEVVEAIARDSYARSARTPDVTAVFARWSACMKAKGYSYAQPMDVNDDPRFHDRDGVRDAEIATATADVACRRRIPVAKVWFEAESALQTEAIKANQGVLNTVRAGIEEAVGRAAAPEGS
ncbi:hypothetical protein ABT071_01855 [Streptomyces sp. NPDC002506]|uniref:hypothetical protein n=1 Tax=Streptomyces sp. NPDC002506 TaxID=3154536 RepID=UPI003317DEDA